MELKCQVWSVSLRLRATYTYICSARVAAPECLSSWNAKCIKGQKTNFTFCTQLWCEWSKSRHSVLKLCYHCRHMLVPSFVMIGPFHARHKSLHNTRNHCDLGKPALSQRKAQLCHASPEKPEKMKMNVGLFLMIIGIRSVVVEAQTSALLSSFDWEDCGECGWGSLLSSSGLIRVIT